MWVVGLWGLCVLLGLLNLMLNVWQQCIICTCIDFILRMKISWRVARHTRFSFYKNILYKNIEDEMGQKVKNILRICSSWTFAYKVKNTLSQVSFLSLHFHFYYYSLQNLLRCLKYICPCYSPFVSYIRLSNGFATSTLGTFTPVCL